MTRFLTAAALLAGLAAPAGAGPIPVVLDTDVGADVDDAFALALAVASPELNLVGVTTVGRGGPPDEFVRHVRKDRDEDRAWLVCRLLTQLGRKDVPVAPGADPQPKSPLDWQVQYRRHPAAVYNRTLQPTAESAVELLARLARAHDGELVVVALGPLTNVARFIREHPDAAKKVKRVVVMGGSVAVGYDGAPKAEPEWNFKTDIPAAKAVLASGLPLAVVPLDATAALRLEKAHCDALFGAHSMLTFQVQNLYELWGKETPVLFDPAAVWAAFDDRPFAWKDLRLEVDDSGMSRAKAGKATARVAVGVTGDEFVRGVVERLRTHGPAALQRPPGNPSKLVPPGAFPARVHVAEDYDTDAEKRWWMCGRAEEKDVPPGGGRAQRGVLTQDFDDRQGDAKTMYRAVIFNPVPGPPVGPKTRLRFKYKLTGTDTLRVQLFSLTNNYHRYLSVAGVEQGKWLDGCVDMTDLRRPDGTGGPLAAGERIDDIQFYVDPRADLLIDDVVLYDAAADGETRPFPRRVLFAAGFDTGQHGKHWPGVFEIVAHAAPRTGKAAKSVPDADGRPALTVGLRGPRRLDAAAELSFRYRFTGRGDVGVSLDAGGKRGRGPGARFDPKAGEWAAATLRFAPGRDAAADAVTFAVPGGAELVVDDVLLYTPGG